MGSMNDASQYESRLWTLLETKQLADLSQYHRAGFFDEVPLYTRESEVAFLPDDDHDANRILMGFALKFLKAVVAYEGHRSGYVAAITVCDFPETRIVPSLFVWCRPPRKLQQQLVLATAATPFGKQIKKLTSSLRLGDGFRVLEDTLTMPETVRAFVSLAKAPYPGFATLDQFRGPVRVAR